MGPFKKSGKFGKRDSFQSVQNMKHRDRGRDRDDDRRSDRPQNNRFDRDKPRDSGRFDKNERQGASFPDKFGGERSKPTRAGFELFQAICDKCGRECDVPFKPTGNKPIYCRTCFRSGDVAQSSTPRFETNSQQISRDEIAQLHRKLDKIMKALKIE
jgi:CxxC-x17-CxxC domain-containing protein